MRETVRRMPNERCQEWTVDACRARHASGPRHVRPARPTVSRRSPASVYMERAPGLREQLSFGEGKT
jgi:hypothetical protein